MLSTTQQAFESIYLADHGGAHALHGVINMVDSGSGPTPVPGSSFYTYDYRLAASPGSGAANWVATSTAASHTLIVHADAPMRWMVNGQILVEPLPPTARVSYVGADVLLEYLADDGQQVAHRTLATRYEVVPLTGALVNAPADVTQGSAFSVVASGGVGGQPLFSTSATWQAGASYVKLSTQQKGDQLLVLDCKEVTRGNAPSPCGAGASTLNDLFPMTLDATLSYSFDQGQVVNVAGVQAWVANTPAPDIATTNYHAFFLKDGGIYHALFIRDGTPTRTFAYGTQTPLDGSIVFNQTAIDSIKAALPF